MTHVNAIRKNCVKMRTSTGSLAFFMNDVILIRLHYGKPLSCLNCFFIPQTGQF